MAKKNGATTNLRLHRRRRRRRLKTVLCLVLGPFLLAAFLCLHLRTLGLFSPAAGCADQTAATDDLVRRLRSLATFRPLRDPRRGLGS
jgi:hypothetical protein